MHASILIRFWVKQFEIKLSIQWQCYNSLDLVLQIYEQKIKVMKCINHFITCSKPSLS